MFMFLALNTFENAHWIFVKMSIFQSFGCKSKHRMSCQLQYKLIAKVVKLTKLSTLTKLDNLA
jgi:hypothetical protein